MNYIKKAVTTLGSIFLAALLLAALAPKAAHGIAAALVQVTNTPANPVSTLAADAATAFVETNTCTFSSPPNYCIVSDIYTVPAGQIAVIDSLSGLCQVDPTAGAGAVEFRLDYSSPSGTPVTSSIAPGPAFKFGSTQQASVGGENFRTYASAGPINLSAVTGADELNTGDFCRMTLSGHLVTP